ncbi:hypothetical protein BD779DRAFT_110918 [Infundibulicybe gibba]|nr:hypothetical protein BD779DRAFT_110918 [Infundibulicybe gibba]
MRGEQILALGIFASYFATILALVFLVVYSSLLPLAVRPRRTSIWPKALVFTTLAAASFAHTWFYMFKYMAWSFSDYERSSGIPPPPGVASRLSLWLTNTALFEQAWAAVCSGPMNWWWSEQLCLFTVGTWTVLLATIGRQHRIRHIWAYMLLGQLVAISVASNLFYLAIILSPITAPPTRDGLSARPTLWISVLLSLVTIGISPFTSDATFLPNLLVMHILIVIPLWSSRTSVIRRGADPPRFSIKVETLYRLSLGMSLLIRSRTILVASAGVQSVSQFSSAVWDTLYSHPAQSSIGWDVIWTTVSFLLWVLLGPSGCKTTRAKYSSLLLVTPITSIGISAPYMLGYWRASEPIWCVAGASGEARRSRI